MIADAWSGALDASFFAEAFERVPFVARRAWPGDLADVMTLTDLEHLLIAPPGAGATDVRLAKVFDGGHVDGITVPPDFALSTILDRYRDGYSVTIDQAAYRWPVFYAMGAALLRTLARRAPSSMRGRASCTVSLTPPHAQGHPRRYDADDRFTLQIEGTQRWRVWAPVRDAPLKNSVQESVDVSDVGPPLFEVTLEPGDVIYIPRGAAHERATGPGHALHVGFGVSPVTWQQVFADMLADRPRWRRSVPKAFLDPDGAGAPLREQFSALVATLDDPAAVRKHFALTAMTHLVTETQTAAGLLAEAVASDGSAPLARPETFEKRYGARHHVEAVGQEISVAFPGSVVRVPAAAAAALERILAGERVTVRELERDAGPDAAREMLARLVGSGFLRPVAERDGGA